MPVIKQEASQKQRDDNVTRQLLFLADYVKPYWKSLIVLVAGNTLLVFLTALMPFIIAPILDIALGRIPDISAEGEAGVGLFNLSLSNISQFVFRWLSIEHINEPFRAVAILALAYVVLGLFQGLVSFGTYLLGLKIRVQVSRRLQFSLFRHILSLSMNFFNKQRIGELVSRLENDTSAATFGIEVIFSRLFTAPILIAFYGLLMIRTSPSLVIGAGLVALLHLVITRGITGPIRERVKEQFTAIADLAARIQETFLNIRIVKSFAAEDFEMSRLWQEIQRVTAAMMRFGIYKHAEDPARKVVTYAAEAVVILLGARELLLGNLEASTFFLFIFVGRAALPPLAEMATSITQLQTIVAATSRLYDLWMEKPQIEGGQLVISNLQEKIEFRDVSFAYDDGTRALGDVNLTLHKGEVIALVGPSGGGKSTLTDLILRFYDPTQGEIQIDGVSLPTLKLDAYRRLFGVVSQESFLFNATVSENIIYGRQGFDLADVEHAARIANAHQFILELPRGYDTIIGDRGVRLSGGQRQRLAIARAVLGKPPIMIFDEATSSLDSESERLVQQAIEQVLEGSTAVIVAHRLSTVLRANRIIVLKDGRIEKIGRHEELLGASPTYARLYQLQFENTPG